MAAVVVDTCVVSFPIAGDTRAELYRPHLHGRQLVISFMTLAEVYRWPLERDWGRSSHTTAATLRMFPIFGLFLSRREC